MTWRDSYSSTRQDLHAEMDHSRMGHGGQSGHGGHGGHHWMMIACCIPMIVIALALAAAGVVSPGFIFFAVMCFGMMWMMMRGMDHMGTGSDPGRR